MLEDDVLHTVLRPAAPEAVGDDDLCHLNCCDPAVALCGARTTEMCPTPTVCTCVECVVCLDLRDVPCVFCGRG